MTKRIDARCIDEADYIIQTKATIRQTAKEFGVSKTTVWNDVSQRLWEINSQTAKQVAKILKNNLDEAHIRGGAAIKAKYNKN